MFIDDILKGGYWPLQHFDARFHRELRIMRYGARIVEDPELRIAVPEDHSTGPVMGGLLWGSTDYQEQPPIWSFAAPVVRAELDPRDAGLGASRSWLLEGGGDWLTPAPKLEAKDLITPFGQKYPLEWPAIAVCSVNADKQNDLALPGFAGLVAPHRAGDPELGTPVWDIDAGRVDPERRARLQSMMRVYRYPAAACVALGAGLEPGGLAWQLGTARAGLGGAGMVADDAGGGIQTIERGASIPQVLATASYRAGGPLHTGGPGDQHNHGTTPDGEAINSLHLSTSSLFLGHGGDAPLFFEGPKQREQSAPLTVPAHLRYDADGKHRTPCGAYDGLWIFQAESFIAKIPDDSEDPDDDVIPFPPRTEPRDDGTTTGGDTSKSGADGWIAGGGVPPQIAPEQQVRQLAGTPMELAAPGFVFRPQNLSTAAIDLRNLPPSMFTAEASKQWSEAPAVLRLESAGTMTGPEWSRTTEPGRGRYAAGGTGSGTLWAMAPELGLELAGVSGLTTSTSALALWDVRLEIGAPGADGALDNGWRFSRDSATGYLSLDNVVSGSASTLLSLTPGSTSPGAIWSRAVRFSSNVTAQADLNHSGSTLGFYGVDSVSQPAAPSDLAGVVSALQSLGLVATS